MRAVVTLLGLGLLALAGCLSNDAPAPDGGATLACAEGGSACPALAGHAVACEGGACVARSPTGDTRFDCAGEGRYGNDLRFDARNCGACGVVCPGSATCVDGACACGAGEARCGGVCVSTATSRAHCGGCGRACGESERCVAGACVACGAGEVFCGDRCARLASDPAHCGGCDQRCGSAETCVDGACFGCPGGRVACGGVCTDLASDDANCGGCGGVCPPGLACLLGACACPTGRRYCGGRCADTTSDPAHCGRCGVACPAGTSCAAGRCTCPAGLELCDGRCVATHDDPMHCGGCSSRCAGVCRARVCYLCAESAICNGRCTDPMTHHSHCGGCGRACGATEACVGGRCEACPGGQTFCALAAACVDFSSSDAHCGVCGLACGARQQCRAGRCVERCDASTSLAHSDANCGACGVVCGAGTLCVDGRCASASPRLKAPISATFVNTARPWFRWELPAGADGARVEVCATRACDRVEASWEAAGDRLRAPTALAPGVHHWRVYARRGGRFDATPSIVWEFAVPGGSVAPAARAPGVLILPDLNGDGVEDRVEASADCGMGVRCNHVRYGRPPAGVAPPDQRIVAYPSLRSSEDLIIYTLFPGGMFLPDRNGDGFGELLTAYSFERRVVPVGRFYQESVRWHAGSSTGVFLEGEYQGPADYSLWVTGERALACVGDRNGDGFGDIARWWRDSSMSLNYSETFGGRGATPSGWSAHGMEAPTWVAVGDFDADGKSDVVYHLMYGAGRLSMGATTLRPLSEATTLRGCPGSDELLARFGAGAADVNDDGYDDLSTTWSDGGTVLSRSLYLGGPDGLSAARCTPLP